MRSKLESYMGFARRSGNLIYGTGTCEINMDKGRVRFMIIAEDTAENSKKKMISKAEKLGIPYSVFGSSDELSRMSGTSGRSIFAVTDRNFADIISKQIELNIRRCSDDDKSK